MPELFVGETIGLLKGFSHEANRMEVEIIVPYGRNGLPGFGEMLLIECAPNHGIVGRVCRYQAGGRLVTEQGEEFLADLTRAQDRPPEDVVGRLLRYSVRLTLLGHVFLENERFVFRAGERAQPPFGCPVRRPSDAALEYLCNVNLEKDPSAAELGVLAYGRDIRRSVPVRFSVERLKGRRSFVFARAGYGKSNLVKYLMSQLHRSPPDVGLLIFDPEGEYALPDAYGRPGLLNVPELADRISFYTEREVPPPYEGSYRGPPLLDFREMLPQEVITHVVPPEKQDTVFANLLRAAQLPVWKQLIQYLAEHDFKAEDQKIAEILHYKPAIGRSGGTDVSLAAIKNNLVPAIRRLHRPDATLARDVIQELREARIVIVDVSLMSAEDAYTVTGMLLWRIFSHNRKHFTDASGAGLRCLAVIEEAQSFLGARNLDERSVFVRWVKEGRKYDLGVLLVTQQPGALDETILSQGDNFFVMHLLNESDLAALRRHNAYYSEDILGVIRGEPIPGNCYFWSAPDQPYVLPVRVHAFDAVARVGRRAPPATARTGAVSAMSLRTLVLRALGEAERVWIYPAAASPETPFGQDIVFSYDYLLNTLAEWFRTGEASAPAQDVDRWIKQELPQEVSAILRELGGVPGRAVLAGLMRPAWRLPLASLRFNKGKKLQPDPTIFEATASAR